MGRKGKFTLKRLTEALSGIIAKRGRLMRIILAIVTVIFLCALLSGLTLIQLALNYSISGAILNRAIPNEQESNVSPSQPLPNYQTSSTISNVGKLESIGIGAYWDAGLTTKVTEIDWGKLEPGGQKSFLVYFRNEGNSNVTLSKSTLNWNPEVASNYLTLSWDYNSQILGAGKSLQVKLILSVNENITGVTNFSFDIIIYGTG